MKRIIQSFGVMGLFLISHSPLFAFQGGDSLEDWKTLSQLTATAESNYAASLDRLGENVFRWKSPAGTFFVLERKKEENQPLGFSSCATPNYMYENVSVYVSVPPQGKFTYLLCQNAFSTVFMTRSDAYGPNGEILKQIVKQVFDDKNRTVRFSAFTVNPKTEQMPYVCELFLVNGQLTYDQAGYLNNIDCVGVLSKAKARVEKFAKSLELQSALVLSSLSS
ncbi:MAG: hypothetical protein KTR32_12395 [Granulosicoccus sp.]|nr:hypothetical protein [Granulosicoccus sp.]